MQPDFINYSLSMCRLAGASWPNRMRKNKKKEAPHTIATSAKRLRSGPSRVRRNNTHRSIYNGDTLSCNDEGSPMKLPPQ